MATASRSTTDPLAVASWSDGGAEASKSSRYLARRLAAAGADYKGVALTTFLLAAAVAVMIWLACGVVVEHWLVPGGLPAWARWAWFAAGLAGLLAALARWIVPLVRYRVNLVYAARIIEQDHPELHNDLVNAVLVQARPDATAPRVARSIERRAAKRLAELPAEGVIDRTAAVRLAYALAGLVALACLYELTAPKSLVMTAARLVAPWLTVAAPARVRIAPPRLSWRMPGEDPPAAGAVDATRGVPVSGGTATLVRGRQLVLSATIQGLRRDERPLLLVTPLRADRRVGAASGLTHARNPDVNALTRMQAARYLLSFQLLKAAESVVGAVTCCSGCFSAYRRSAIEPLLDEWSHQRFLGVACTYGDDRALTNRVIRAGHRSLYHSGAVAVTDVPETWSTFFRQQLRWKKSWVREGPILLSHLWRSRPVAFPFMVIAVVVGFLSPVIAVASLVVAPSLWGQIPFVYAAGLVTVAIAYAVYHRSVVADGRWGWSMAATAFYLGFSFQILWAMVRVRDGRWGTRSA